MKNNLEWTAPEFEYYRKDKSWLVIAGLIAAGLFLWALLTKNIIFALLIGLSYFTVITYGLKKPASVKLAVTAKGIKINQALYEFDNLKSFWIFYQPPQIREISLRSKKTIMPYIKIPLGEQNPVEIRKILLKYLPERRHKESLIDNLSRSLRF
ncbi:MAG: hypothetical protein COS49_00800 [Candidatus Portnoybacteria bacterium CG03_land_8_20_14_0_80_41_10]|uniref:DUF5673 domain-containing protein n=1 Tax=Candidatus Portnoybacteria bacterium CG03_land_8_20_14_0_80_41_10 TaxID=1974808 RepID=A0A2M7BUY7_9BACT|nr:MAG: hypothetical protein COS49_00800 [Candidatus Portnoybacteria bacterium CG03_land_8_20_14_0_80_41_10]